MVTVASLPVWQGQLSRGHALEGTKQEPLSQRAGPGGGAGGGGAGGVTRALRLASPGSLFHWRSLCVRVLRTLETALVLPEDLPSACLGLVGAGKCPPELTYQREPGEGGVAAANGRLLKKAESPGRTDDLDRPLLPPRGRRG